VQTCHRCGQPAALRLSRLGGWCCTRCALRAYRRTTPPQRITAADRLFRDPLAVTVPLRFPSAVPLVRLN
jgi:hypothetical protein